MSSFSQVIRHPSLQALISLHPSIVISLGSLSHNSTVTQVFTNISSPLLYEGIHFYSSYSRKESSPVNAQSIDLINVLALVGKCSSDLCLSPNGGSLLGTLWEGIRAPVRKIWGLENVSSSALDTSHSRSPGKVFSRHRRLEENAFAAKKGVREWIFSTDHIHITQSSVSNSTFLIIYISFSIIIFLTQLKEFLICWETQHSRIIS